MGTTDSRAWFGSEALAVLIPGDGRWRGMGPSRNFFDKFWVWRRGYSPKAEPVPALTLAGVKLDAGDQPQRMQVDEATNAFGPGWTSMLTGMEFPSAGCWQVTAKYVYIGIIQELTFVLDVHEFSDSGRSAPSGSGTAPAAAGYADPGASGRR